MELISNYMVFVETSTGIKKHICNLKKNTKQAICGAYSDPFLYPSFRFYENREICKRCLTVAKGFYYADIKE